MNDLSLLYGNQLCFSCSLTIASFLNGGLYSTPKWGLQPYHHECFHQIQPSLEEVKTNANESRTEKRPMETDPHESFST